MLYPYFFTPISYSTWKCSQLDDAFHCRFQELDTAEEQPCKYNPKCVTHQLDSSSVPVTYKYIYIFTAHDVLANTLGL